MKELEGFWVGLVPLRDGYLGTCFVEGYDRVWEEVEVGSWKLKTNDDQLGSSLTHVIRRD
jgi:hypothetical protein